MLSPALRWHVVCDLPLDASPHFPRSPLPAAHPCPPALCPVQMRTWMREALNSSIAPRGVRYKPLSPLAEDGPKVTGGIRSRIPGGSPPASAASTHLDSDGEEDGKGSDDGVVHAKSGRRLDTGRGLGGGGVGLGAGVGAGDVGAGGASSGSSSSTSRGVRREAKSHGPLCAYQNVCPGLEMIRTPALYLSYTCDTGLLYVTPPAPREKPLCLRVFLLCLWLPLCVAFWSLCVGL
jgi:hypothetical protein